MSLYWTTMQEIIRRDPAVIGNVIIASLTTTLPQHWFDWFVQ